MTLLTYPDFAEEDLGHFLDGFHSFLPPPDCCPEMEVTLETTNQSKLAQLSENYRKHTISSHSLVVSIVRATSISVVSVIAWKLAKAMFLVSSIDSI